MNPIIKKRFVRIIMLVLIAFIILAALSGTIMSRVNEPKYGLVKSETNIQIRDYDPMVVAEAEVIGDRLPAINQGFRMIADYIFGNNIPKKKLAMTTPVTQQAGDKIAMTAPVTQQGNGNIWKVRFVMPAEYTLETLPVPSNKLVKLISIPRKRFVAIRFSGFNTDRNMNTHQRELFEYVSKNMLVSVGEPIMAFYNPPWTLPFLRRNEIMIELKR